MDTLDILDVKEADDNDVHFNADGVQVAKPLYFFLERYMDSFIAGLNEFVQCVLEIRTPPLSGIDGPIHVLIEMAAKKSYPEHRHVKLSEFEHPVPAVA